MLTDHEGAPLSARGILVLGAVVICGLAVAQSFGWATAVAGEALWILAGMAVALQAIKGDFETMSRRVTWAGVRLIVALWGSLLLGIGIVVAVVVVVVVWVI